MIGRSETIIKWLLFSGATALALLGQGFLLQFIRVAGVIPFLYPVLPALAGMFEGPFGGSVYALALGVLCDLTLPGPIPCLYTLAFPLAGLLAGLLARGALPAGLPCAVVSTVAAFFLTDLLRCAALVSGGQGALAAAALVAVRETAVTLPLMLPVYFLFRAIHRKCHLYD